MTTEHEARQHAAGLVDTIGPLVQAFADLARHGAPDTTLIPVSHAMVDALECRCGLRVLSLGLAQTAGKFLTDAAAREGQEFVGIDPETTSRADAPVLLALRMAVACANGDLDTAAALHSAGPVEYEDPEPVYDLLAAQSQLLAATIRGEL